MKAQIYVCFVLQLVNQLQALLRPEYGRMVQKKLLLGSPWIIYIKHQQNRYWSIPLYSLQWNWKSSQPFTSYQPVSTGTYLLGDIYTFFLIARAEGIQEILQSNWFRELAEFYYSAGLHLASYADDHAINVEITLESKTADALCNHSYETRQAKVSSDHRSKFSNLGNWKEEE